MRGSIQAPSYEEWSEAKKLAEGEDSDVVAVDEGRDVVGRPPASRRDWRRSSEMENYGNIEEKLKERAAQQAAMENARTGRSGRNVVADAAKESPPKGKSKKEVKSGLGGLFTKLAAEQADPSSVEPQADADADPANRGSTGSEVEGLDESVDVKLSSGDQLTERMRRSSSHKAAGGKGRGMSVTHDLRDSVLEASAPPRPRRWWWCRMPSSSTTGSSHARRTSCSGRRRGATSSSSSRTAGGGTTSPTTRRTPSSA